MDLLQYSFTLDPEFPMSNIRERVAAKRHLMDAVPGLCWKAWLLSEALPGRLQPKGYAPVYLFDDTLAVQAFLRGDLYRAVTESFGWTRPHHGHALGDPRASIAGARSCALTVSSLDDHAALHRTLAPSSGVPPSLPVRRGVGAALSTVRQLDISRMQLREYAFWTCEADALAGIHADIVYEVVAVSSPLQSRS